MTIGTINSVAQQFANQQQRAVIIYHQMIVAAVAVGDQIDFAPIIEAGASAGFDRQRIAGHLQKLQQRKDACNQKLEAMRLNADARSLKEKFDATSQQIEKLRAEFEAKCSELRGDLDHATYQAKCQSLMHHASSLERDANLVLQTTAAKSGRGDLAPGFGEWQDWTKIDL